MNALYIVQCQCIARLIYINIKKISERRKNSEKKKVKVKEKEKKEK